MGIPKQVLDLEEELDRRGLVNESVCNLLLLLRKPARAEAMSAFLEVHKAATEEQILREAHRIARTVEPTVRKPK